MALGDNERDVAGDVGSIETNAQVGGAGGASGLGPVTGCPRGFLVVREAKNGASGTPIGLLVAAVRKSVVWLGPSGSVGRR